MGKGIRLKPDSWMSLATLFASIWTEIPLHYFTCRASKCVALFGRISYFFLVLKAGFHALFHKLLNVWDYGKLTLFREFNFPFGKNSLRVILSALVVVERKYSTSRAQA